MQAGVRSLEPPDDKDNKSDNPCKPTQPRVYRNAENYADDDKHEAGGLPLAALTRDTSNLRRSDRGDGGATPWTSSGFVRDLFAAFRAFH